MATSYNVYANDGLGGPVDYSTVIVNTSGLSYVGAPLAAPSDNLYAVRATDGASEEQNIDCRVRIVIDADGNDVSAIPNPPGFLSAVALAGGGARVDWMHVPVANTPLPTGFKVWITPGPTVDYAAPPVTTVGFVPRTYRYSATIASGLSDGVSYSVGVRATNASGDEANTLRAGFVGIAVPPDAVTGLTGAAVFLP